MSTLRLSNSELFFVDRRPPGKNPSLLFIHGAASTHDVWPQSLCDLPGVRSIVLDLPGHGRSAPPGRRSIAGYAEVIERLIDALGLEDVVLVGHSMGSAIALTVACRSKAAVRGLVLIGAAARMPVHDSVLRKAANASNELPTFIAANGLGMAIPGLVEIIQRETRAVEATTVFGDFLACNQFDLRHSLATIGIPALIITGELDRMTPPRFSESLVAGLPDARLVTLDETGHFAMLEKTAEVRDLLAGFIDSLALAQPS